jgi:hypothetical protein
MTKGSREKAVGRFTGRPCDSMKWSLARAIAETVTPGHIARRRNIAAHIRV